MASILLPRRYGVVPFEEMVASEDANAVSAKPTSAAGYACPACGQRFFGEASFCPFDGEHLHAVSEVSSEPLLRQVIDGRYEVQTVLGEGGMGTVYGVSHVALGRRFALKVMRLGLVRDGHAARFMEEAKAAAAIDHPNVVQITDFGELPDRRPYFVMELLEGEPLSTLIERSGGLAPPRAARILSQIAAGLAAAHDKGVVHRDLRPENIYVLSHDRVKILDFGLAKSVGVANLTRQGGVVGSPEYMSPEQARGGDVDHRSDIYALGVIMYEMLTGRAPFQSESYVGLLEKHLSAEPHPPSTVAPSVAASSTIEQVTMRCLEKRPSARYPSAEAVLDAIESSELAESDQAQSFDRTDRPATSPRSSSHLGVSGGRTRGHADVLGPTAPDARSRRRATDRVRRAAGRVNRSVLPWMAGSAVVVAVAMMVFVWQTSERADLDAIETDEFGAVVEAPSASATPQPGAAGASSLMAARTDPVGAVADTLAKPGNPSLAVPRMGPSPTTIGPAAGPATTPDGNASAVRAGAPTTAQTARAAAESAGNVQIAKPPRVKKPITPSPPVTPTPVYQPGTGSGAIIDPWKK